ncbi:MAG: hypothetical protein WCH58_04580 [Candidatus Saccharibacteria bacterium]
MKKLNNKRDEKKLVRLTENLYKQIPNHLKRRSILDYARGVWQASLQASKIYKTQKQVSAKDMATKDTKIAILLLLFANQKGYRFKLAKQKKRLLTEY